MHLDGLNGGQKYERDISTATSESQALEAAINAAESYMKALQLTDSPREKRNLDVKCKELLTRAEHIKDGKPWTASSQPSRSSVIKDPGSSRKRTTREEIILLEGAKLNGFVFPPWKADPNPKEFTLETGQTRFTYVTECYRVDMEKC